MKMVLMHRVETHSRSFELNVLVDRRELRLLDLYAVLFVFLLNESLLFEFLWSLVVVTAATVQTDSRGDDERACGWLGHCDCGCTESTGCTE